MGTSTVGSWLTRLNRMERRVGEQSTPADAGALLWRSGGVGGALALPLCRAQPRSA